MTYDDQGQIFINKDAQNTIILGALMTFFMSLGITLYSWNTKKDFTLEGSILWTGLLSLIILFFFAAIL